MEITQKEQDAWPAGIDAGREIERHNAAQAQPEPLQYGHDRDDNYVTGWNDCVAALRSEQPVSGADGLPTPFAVLALEKNGSVSVFADSVALSERAIDDSDRAWAASRQARLVEVYTAQPQPSGNAHTNVAETLVDAIYKTAQRAGIANADHSSLSVSQCLHLLDCIVPSQPSGNAEELDEREAFEAWAATQSESWLIVGGLTWSPGTNDYASARTNAAFAAWQARAALAAQASGQDREDAERYCWLRDNAQLFSHFGEEGNSGWCVMRRDSAITRVFTYNGQELDEAIDAARAAAKGEA